MGLSMTTGRQDGNQPDTFPNLLRSLEDLRTRREAVNGAGAH